MWNKFENFIQIIRTSAIDKIVGYNSIYALITFLLEGNQFINPNSSSDISCILSNLRQKRMHLFCIIYVFFFIFSLGLGHQAGHA